MILNRIPDKLKLSVQSKNYLKYFSDKIFLIGISSILIRVLNTTIITYFTIKYLKVSEYSFWLVITAFIGFFDLFDFGSSSTLIRKINYILAGRSILPDEIYDKNNSSFSGINYHLLQYFKSKVNKYYRGLSFFFFIGLALFGSIYIYYLRVREIDYVMWAIFVLFSTLHFRLKFLEIYLLGHSKIIEVRLSQIFANCIQVMIVSYCFFSGFGLFSLFIGTFIFFVVQNLFFWYYHVKIQREVIISSNIEVFSFSIWNLYSKEIWKFGLTTISGFIFSKSIFLLVALYSNPKLTVQYGITVQILSLISLILSQYINNSAPLLNRLVALKNVDELKRFWFFNLFTIIIFFGVSTILIAFFGEKVLQMVNPSYNLLDGKYLCLLALFFCSELIMSLTGQVLLAFNFVEFYKNALLAVFLLFLFFFPLNFLSNDFLLMLLVSQLIAQLYNYWKWPRFAYKKILKLN